MNLVISGFFIIAAIFIFLKILSLSKLYSLSNKTKNRKNSYFYNSWKIKQYFYKINRKAVVTRKKNPWQRSCSAKRDN